jgi:signal transduction histidine kinase/DNA-binding response OmpR family regulator
MAAADDRRALERDGGDRLRFSWLGAIGLGLVLALLAAVFVQVRQFELLEAATDGDEYDVLLVYQAEAEYLRLRERWWRIQEPERAGGQASDGAATPLNAEEREALQLRYEIWVSRVGLLQTAHMRNAMPGDADTRRTLADAAAFIADADRALGNPPAVAPDRAFLAALWPRLEALGPGLHALTLATAHRVDEANERRAAAAQVQSRLGLALTTFLGALTLAFAAVSLRHVRQLRERRIVLEELATKLRIARREAEAASEAKSVFLANISHEVRTPFQGLMGMLSLLRETGLNARQIDYLRTATESADHLLAILNDILDMSQLESGRMTLHPAPVELRTLLRDVEALMRPQAMAKQLALHLDTHPDVPERVLADATRVKQVVFNLLSNAIKFSEHGAVVLDVRRLSPEAGGAAMLEFAVTDTGIGMDEATLARLFNRFAQGDSSRSRRFGGAGLGLEISRNLARLMGGDITVRSKPGEGSRFAFTMPLQALEQPPRPAHTAGAPADAPLRALDVLVAEDHPVNRQYLAALLESMGHHAHFTTNGEEAVAAAREHRFDLVLMDLHMPVLDGVGATRAIRALAAPGAATVPIVALTADAFPETRERCLVAGMNDFLTKPVSPQKLATSLRRLFGAGAGAGPAPLMPPPPPPSRGEAPLIDDITVAMALEVMPRERLAGLIDQFLSQGPQTVERLRTAMRDAQPLELRVNAHAVKGAALNLGLGALGATAEALQEGAAHLPAHEIARLVQRYEELLAPTRTAAARLGLLPAAATASGAAAALVKPDE